MTDFDRALKATLAYEGGRVDDPADPGGRTAYGITQRTFNGWLDSMKRPRRDVWTITYDEIKAIYQRDYWDVVTQGRIWPLNAALFDAAVNSGPRNALWMLARAKALHPEYDKLDNVTRQFKLAFAVMDVRRQFFRNIVANRPLSAKFLRGWLKRCDQLQQLCSTPARAPLGLLMTNELPEISGQDYTPRTDDIDAAELHNAAD